ncbi:MAG: hypothetical protein ACLFSB_03140 [Chitinispirillaceae bacterium]
MVPLSLGVSLGLDLLLDDPRRPPHPVRWIGGLIIVLQRCIYPLLRSLPYLFYYV